MSQSSSYHSLSPRDPLPPHASLAERILADPLPVLAEYYALCLPNSQKVRDALRDRWNLTIEAARQRCLGFSDRSLGKQLPGRESEQGRRVRDLLTRLGVYKPNGRERLRGYLTEPVRDASGEIVAIRGYKLDRHAAGPEMIECGREFQSVEEPRADACEHVELTATEPLLETEVTQQPSQDEAPIVPEVTEPSHRPLQPSTSQVAVDQPEPEKPAPSEVTADEPADDPGSNEPSEPDSPLRIDQSGIHFTAGDRHYRIRGLERNQSLLRLQVNLLVRRQRLAHLDSLDLAKARARATFIQAAADELFVEPQLIKQDLGQLLLQLESLQYDRLAARKSSRPEPVELSGPEREAGLALLSDPRLIERIGSDLEQAGLVGEASSRLLAYLAATSRLLPQPLCVIIQSASAAGKTSLMDAVLSLMPEESIERFSAVTAQSLYYLESDQLRHRTLAISEEAGLGEAAYALKLLQSEGRLRHAAVSRTPEGTVRTELHTIEGPVQLFLTTTSPQIDPELANRALLLEVDESPRQTERIQRMQRQQLTAAFTRRGLELAALRSRHHSAQRLLRRLPVLNPYAPQLTFPSQRTRLRRDHVKYLTLIQAIALLHQYQRPLRRLEADSPEGETIEYIEVEPSDIALAGRLIGPLLAATLDDLPPPTRRVLRGTSEYVTRRARTENIPVDAVRFTRRELRQALGLGHSQLAVHLCRLVELEYVRVHRGRNGQRYVYELLSEAAGEKPESYRQLLTDPDSLRPPASHKESSEAEPSGLSEPPSG